MSTWTGPCPKLLMHYLMSPSQQPQELGSTVAPILTQMQQAIKSVTIGNGTLGSCLWSSDSGL